MADGDLNQESVAAEKPEVRPLNTMDDVDALLAEFDASLPPKEPETPAEQPETPTEPEDTTQRLERLESENDKRVYADALRVQNADIDSAVADVHRGIEGAVSEDSVKKFLLGEFYTDPRFAAAFTARNKAPDVWGSALKRATKALEKELASRPDPEVTADVEAMTSAVRAAQTPGAQDDSKAFDEWARNASDSEMAKWKRNNGGF